MDRISINIDSTVSRMRYLFRFHAERGNRGAQSTFNGILRGNEVNIYSSGVAHSPPRIRTAIVRLFTCTLSTWPWVTFLFEQKNSCYSFSRMTSANTSVWDSTVPSSLCPFQ